jgi:hypothetical protein
MTEDIEQLLGGLDGNLAPIREVATRHWAINGAIDPRSGAVSFDHRPKFAPEAALVLYPGLTPSDLARYEELAQTRREFSIAIPSSYRQVLSKQPLDVGEANRRWRIRYRPVPLWIRPAL